MVSGEKPSLDNWTVMCASESGRFIKLLGGYTLPRFGLFWTFVCVLVRIVGQGVHQCVTPGGDTHPICVAYQKMIGLL